MKTTTNLCTPQVYGKLEPTTEERYWEMLEVLPPAHMMRGGFAVGEPYADRIHFGGEFEDEDAFLEVFNCYYQLGSEPNAKFLHGFFTLKDYEAVTRADLEAVSA